MWKTILSSILLSFIIYNAQIKWAQYRSINNFYEYQSERKSNKVFTDNTKEFEKPEIIKVTDGIYMAIGYALANSILLTGPEGAVIIDTVESISPAEKIFAEFRKITDLPIKGVIYTHNHIDHINGAKAFLKEAKEPYNDIEIWAHHSLMDIFLHTMVTLGPISFKRGMRQFGALLPKDEENAGIGYRLEYNRKSKDGFVPPNRFLYTDEINVTIAGIHLNIFHVPGETDDQIAVYWPEKKALFCADDVYRAFPNLYAIRGTPFRSLALWTNSLDKMRSKNAEHLVPSHTRPVQGATKILNLLTDYRDAVQLVHDQTVRWTNLGLHPEEIAAKVHLTPALQSNDYLKEMYGTVRWSVKSLFAGYLGWFSGEVEDLNPFTPTDFAKRLVTLAGGIDATLVAAQNAFNGHDYQWALQLTQAVLRIHQDNSLASDIKVKSIFELANQQTSSNGYNYYMTSAYESLGQIEKIVPQQEVKQEKIMRMPLHNLFQTFAYRMRAEECSQLNKTYEFQFDDINQVVNVSVRHGIMDLKNAVSLASNGHVRVTCSSVLFRQIVAEEKNALSAVSSGQLTVEPGILALKELFDCIDKSD